MLVLTRKRHETIEIGESIVIRVIQIKGNKVRIGIEAPSEWSIRRGEVRQRDEGRQPDLLNVTSVIPHDCDSLSDE